MGSLPNILLCDACMNAALVGFIFFLADCILLAGLGYIMVYPSTKLVKTAGFILIPNKFIGVGVLLYYLSQVFRSELLFLVVGMLAGLIFVTLSMIFLLKQNCISKKFV